MRLPKYRALIAERPYGYFIRTNPPWNKGLCKDNDVRLAKVGVKLSREMLRVWKEDKEKRVAAKRMPEARLKTSKGVKRFFANPKNLKAHSERMTMYWEGLTPAERNEIMRSRRTYDKKAPTAPEEAVIDILNSLDIHFVFQYRLLGFVADFYLPKSNTIIECNGVYWHKNPKAVRHDKKKKTAYIKAGYNVLVLTDHEIRKDLRRVTRIIAAVAK